MWLCLCFFLIIATLNLALVFRCILVTLKSCSEVFGDAGNTVFGNALLYMSFGFNNGSKVDCSRELC